MRPHRPAPRRRPAPAARLALGAALALAAAAPQAGAQRARGGADTVPPAPWERRSPVRVAVGGAGLFQSAGGRTGAGLADGGGFDAFGALQVSALSLGVGYQRTEHRIQTAGAGRALYHGVFVEPRVGLAQLRNFTPYLAGRASFLRQRVPQTAQFRGDSRSLTALGAGVGTLVWLAPSVQLDLAGLYTDVRGGRSAQADAFSGGPGRGALLRAGLVIGLDAWGR